MNESINENWYQSVLEVARHSSLSFSLEGWPAAITLISISGAAVLIFAIKNL